MSMGVSPGFITTLNTKVAALTTANTSLTGSGTVVLLFTVGLNGSLLEEIIIKAAGTTTSGMIRIFLKRSSTYYLIHEEVVSAATPSATVKAFAVRVAFYESFISGDEIYGSTEKSENFNVVAIGGDY